MTTTTIAAATAAATLNKKQLTQLSTTAGWIETSTRAVKHPNPQLPASMQQQQG
jgi:hypothetical protein